LNELKGQSVPALLAELIHDLSRELSLEDMASQLPYDIPQLDDYLRLLQIPDNLESQLAAEAERMERERTRVLAFALSAEQEVVIEEALAKAASVAGSQRAAALTHVARTFLKGAE